jgi:hypothetical protein
MLNGDFAASIAAFLGGEFVVIFPNNEISRECNESAGLHRSAYRHCLRLSRTSHS